MPCDMQEAANKMLNHGSSFLHPESANPAADGLACFTTVAQAVIHMQRWVACFTRSRQKSQS